MEHSFIVALFIISLTLTTLNNGADSDESDSSFYSSEDSFLTLSDDVKDLIVSSESEMDYDQSSVNPSKKIQFRQGIMNIMQQSGGGSQSVGIYGMPGFGIPGFGTAKCSEGFLLIEDECFFFSHDKASWDDARMKCQQMGSSLATFNRDSLWNAVKRHFEKIVGKDTNKYWWTSGNDRQTEGRYVWETTGELFNSRYWCNKQPDNLNGKEHCLHTRWGQHNDNTYCFNDDLCLTHYYYICQKRM